MLSIIIPVLNAARTLPGCLAALRDSGMALPVNEIIVVDGGSTDGSAQIARAAGARVIVSGKGRGLQLNAGARAARGSWYLFLHADTVLDAGWAEEALSFIGHVEANSGKGAAAFRFRLDDQVRAARRVERLVAWRGRRLGLPYGDQGLLIPREFYDAVGGFKAIPLMEDVDLVRRIGRRHITILDISAVTDAARYRRGGYWLRPMRNLCLVSLYFLGVPPRILARFYP